MTDYTLTCIPALDLLRSLPDKSVDHTVTDPPYNKFARHARSLHKGRACDGTLPPSDGLGGVSMGIKWDLSHADIFALVPEILRVTRRWSIIFCALEQLGIYQLAGAEVWIRAGVWNPDVEINTDDGPAIQAGMWDRHNTGTPQLTGDRPAQGAEGIAIFHSPGKKRWNSRGKRGIWRHAVVRPASKTDPRYHPAQKPLALMSEIVQDFTDPEDLILDPYMGSGTTGVAALKLGRRFIGNDQDPMWLEASRARIETT